MDGVTFQQIESQGRQEWLRSLQEDLRSKSYRPQPVRRVMIFKPGGGERPLGIPTIRDRVAFVRIQWLEWLTIVLSLISATVAVITVLGCEKMVPELLRASLPLIGILTFSFVVVCVIGRLRENVKKYILELDDLVEIWGRILYPRDDVPLTIQEAARYGVPLSDLDHGAVQHEPSGRLADAIRRVHELLCKGYTDVVDAALSKYFDTIPHADRSTSTRFRTPSCCSAWRGAFRTGKSYMSSRGG